MGELEESIFVERENTQSMQDSINKLKMELEESKRRLEEMEHSYEQLME
jgi:trehalose-6-phosphate synthase